MIIKDILRVRFFDYMSMYRNQKLPGAPCIHKKHTGGLQIWVNKSFKEKCFKVKEHVWPFSPSPHVSLKTSVSNTEQLNQCMKHVKLWPASERAHWSAFHLSSSGCPAGLRQFPAPPSALRSRADEQRWITGPAGDEVTRPDTTDFL